MIIILQVLFILLFPFFSKKIVQKLQVQKFLSPVVLCYGVGILIASFKMFPVHTEIATQFSHLTILFAIPLLLYSTDILAWFKYARSTTLSFFLCILSSLICTFTAGFLLESYVEDSWLISGMLVGLYTGGIANLQAIGLGLGASDEIFVLLNAADIITGGILLIWLTSVAHTFLGYFLPDFQEDKTIEAIETIIDSVEKRSSWITDFFYAMGLTILIIGISVGSTYLITGAIESVSLLILLLTTCSIVASMNPKIRAWKNTFAIGDYFLLMFCVAIGLLADFSTILDGSLTLIIYTAVVLLSSVILHYLLCWYFKIDRDTVMITATAALYGPVFIGQVASAISNKKLVFSGIATGLIGYAVGNYLGIGMGYLLKYLLS